MSGEVGSGRSAGLPRGKPRGCSSALRELDELGYLSRQPCAIGLQFCSSHRSSRICSNSLKTNDG